MTLSFAPKRSLARSLFYRYHAEFACRVVFGSLIDVRLVQGCIQDEEERGRAGE